jgi:hypothetical protein
MHKEIIDEQTAADSTDLSLQKQFSIHADNLRTPQLYTHNATVKETRLD